MVFYGLGILAGGMTLLCLVSLVSGNAPAREAEHLLGRFGFVPPDSGNDKTPDPRVTYLNERNPFTPPKNPWSARLVGVLGEWAFFENSPGLKVGETHNGAKITSIGPDWVEVDVDGKTQKVNLYQGGPSFGGPPSGPMPAGGGARPSGPPPGFQMNPQMLEHFKKLPPDVRAKAMQNMPPRIREQLLKAM